MYSELLPEIQQIEQRAQELKGRARVEVLCESECHGKKLPVYKLTFGSEDPTAPTLGLIGGVHGLERIGAQVVVSLLNYFSELSLWDRGTQELLKSVRVFFIPVVNPWGIHNKTRSNPRGVDLMRNAPVEGEGDIPFLLGGHRYSNKWPWFRGQVDSMEMESSAVFKAVQKEGFQSRALLTCDFHSGFGFQDQLWFPYAKSTQAWPDVAYAHSFKALLDRNLPHHFYLFEPQAKNYTTHGDLWDYTFDEFRKQSKQVYLPLCLEMGSWMWLKKNPWQIFSADGPFNPLIGHRHSRTLRRHNSLFELLLRAVHNPESWADLSLEQKSKHEFQAKELWYDRN